MATFNLSIPEPSNQQLTDFSKKYSADQQALLDRQKAEQEGLFGQYEQQLSSQEKLPALYTRLQSEAGIPQLNEQRQTFNTQIAGVKNLLDRLDEDVTSRTAGTMTTEAQRRRILGAEGETLNNQLGRLGSGLQPIADLLGSANEQVGNLLNLNVQQQEKELSPVTMRINALGDRFAREITGFNDSRQQELNTILDKLQRERALNDREWQQAAELAKQEAAFSQQKNLVMAQLGSGPQIGTAASTGISQQQQQDYNFVKNLINEVNSGNGEAASAIIAQARAGDPRSKDIMRSFYSLQNKPIPSGFRSFL